MRAFHCTTPKMLKRYCETGAILPPVRFFSLEDRAKEWARKVQREVVVGFEVEEVYPLPDHRPAAYWTPRVIHSWDIVVVRSTTPRQEAG